MPRENKVTSAKLEVVTNTLEMQDISMSDIRTLQHLRSQLSNAAENLK